jgi:hypothetical protein
MMTKLSKYYRNKYLLTSLIVISFITEINLSFSDSQAQDPPQENVIVNGYFVGSAIGSGVGLSTSWPFVEQSSDKRFHSNVLNYVEIVFKEHNSYDPSKKGGYKKGIKPWQKLLG